MGQQAIQTDRRSVQVPATLDALRANAEAFRALAQGIEADFRATRERVEAELALAGAL